MRSRVLRVLALSLFLGVIGEALDDDGFDDFDESLQDDYFEDDVDETEERAQLNKNSNFAADISPGQIKVFVQFCSS